LLPDRQIGNDNRVLHVQQNSMMEGKQQLSLELADDDLEGVVLERFDRLVANGDIFYEDLEPEIVIHNGFQV
jgi:hypothetical protein